MGIKYKDGSMFIGKAEEVSLPQLPLIYPALIAIYNKPKREDGESGKRCNEKLIKSFLAQYWPEEQQHPPIHETLQMICDTLTHYTPEQVNRESIKALIVEVCKRTYFVPEYVEQYFIFPMPVRLSDGGDSILTFTKKGKNILSFHYKVRTENGKSKEFDIRKHYKYHPEIGEIISKATGTQKALSIVGGMIFGGSLEDLKQ